MNNCGSEFSSDHSPTRVKCDSLDRLRALEVILVNPNPYDFANRNQGFLIQEPFW